MNSFSLPSDDQPPAVATNFDISLRRQLEVSASKHFFEACDGPTQSLLMNCRWTISAGDVLLLKIYCADQLTNWRVLNHLPEIAVPLAQFGPHAKIRVHPPSGTGDPFVMRVDERSEYRDRIFD